MAVLSGVQTKADKDPVGLVYACLVDQRASADQVSPIVSRQGSLLIKQSFIVLFYNRTVGNQISASAKTDSCKYKKQNFFL